MYVLFFLLWLRWFDQNEDSVHQTFRWCCVNARPSPKLLEDLCGLKLTAHVANSVPSHSVVELPELMCWFGGQVCSFRAGNSWEMACLIWCITFTAAESRPHGNLAGSSLGDIRWMASSLLHVYIFRSSFSCSCYTFGSAQPGRI